MSYKKLANDYGIKYIGDEVATEGIAVLAYEDGFKKAIDMCINKVDYSRFSIVLANNDHTRGYIQACEDIKNRLIEVGKV